MATIWKEGSTDYFVISTNRDSLGITDWKVFASDLSTGVVTEETANVTVSEIEYTIASPAAGEIVITNTSGKIWRAVVVQNGFDIYEGTDTNQPPVDFLSWYSIAQ